MLKHLLLITVAISTAHSLDPGDLAPLSSPGQDEYGGRYDLDSFEEIKVDEKDKASITKMDNTIKQRNKRNIDDDYFYGYDDYLDENALEGDHDGILDPRTICGGNETICADLEDALEEKARQIISTNLNMTSMHVKVIRGEKPFVEKCNEILAKQNISISIMLKRRGADYWISHMHREEFYEQCLKNYDIYRLSRKATYVVKKLNQYANDIGEALEHKGNVQIGGGSSEIIGGIMGGLGLILAPITAGASLTLSVGGSALATGGSLAVFFQSKLTESWTADVIQKSIDLATQTDREMDFVQKLLGLYINSQLNRVRYLNSNDYVNIRDTFQHLLEEQTRGGLMGSVNAVNFVNFAREAYVTYIRNHPASLPSRSVARVNGFTHVIINKFQLYTAKDAFIKMKSWKISGVVKTKIGRVVGKVKNGANKITRGMVKVGNALISSLNIGFGIYDVLEGTKNIAGTGDLKDTLRAASKTYSYDADSTLEAFRKIVGEPNIKGYEESYQEVTRISVKSVNGQRSAGTKLFLKSRNPHNESDVGTCETGILDENSWHKLTSGYWYFVEDAELKDCRYFKIYYNGSIEVRMVNDYYDEVAFSHITLSTETKIAPSFACSDDGTESRMHSSKISSYSGSPSPPLKCFPLQGITMIKTHTCARNWAGTDGDVRMRITQCNKKAGGICSGIENAYCTTNWLDNPGNDREYNQIDTYRIDQLDECTEPFHEDFSPENGFLKTRIEFESWLHDGWCIDFLKIYAKTSIVEDKPFKCDIENKGDGYWFDGGKNSKSSTCKLEKPNKRGIEKIHLHVTDSYYAASSGRLQLTICNDNDTNQVGNPENSCCTTNIINGTFVRNEEFIVKDDHHLGKCEAFIVKGSTVTVRIKKVDGNAVSFDKIEFFGASDILITTSDIPFIKCQGNQIWAETGKVYWHYYNGTESSWMDWNTPEATWKCSYESHTSIMNVHVRLCSDDSAGTDSTIETVFTNVDEKTCTTQNLKFSNDTYLGSGDYHTFRDVGNCSSLQVIDDRVDMELRNMDEKDNLCLTHIWIDVSNSKGNTKQLQCKFHANKKQLNIIGRKGSMLPMRCQ